MIREIVWRKMQAQEELGFCQSSKIGTVKEELLSSKRKSKIGKVEKVKSQLLSSVQSLSHVQLFVTRWTSAHQASQSITKSWSFLKLVHRVSDSIRSSHPLPSPSPAAFYLSQHESLFQWVSSSHQVGKILKIKLQHQSFQWIFRTVFL